MLWRCSALSPNAVTIAGTPTSTAPYALTTWQPNSSSSAAAVCGCRYAPPLWTTRSDDVSTRGAASIRTISVGSVNSAVTRCSSISDSSRSTPKLRGRITLQPVIADEQSPLM